MNAGKEGLEKMKDTYIHGKLALTTGVRSNIVMPCIALVIYWARNHTLYAPKNFPRCNISALVKVASEPIAFDECSLYRYMLHSGSSTFNLNQNLLMLPFWRRGVVWWGGGGQLFIPFYQRECWKYDNTRSELILIDCL